MGVNGEALQLRAFYKKPYFLLQVTREFVSVLQVTWESVSGTASHARCIWTCNEIKGLYDKIIITIAPSYTGKNITSLLPSVLLLMLRTCNNTDGNKLVIFSGIASYYGDNYILYHTSNSRKCMEVNGEALQLHAVYKKPYFLLQIMREFASVLQVTRTASECAMKSKVHMIKSLSP